jgi:beta-mannanase
VSNHDSHAILRLGWEMNGNWFPWSIQNGNAANYAAYWQQIVTTMRAVSPSFRFDWCPNSGSVSVNGVLLNPAAAYPGDRYVNYIGSDIYDKTSVTTAQNAAKRWHSYLTQPYGLEWQKNFAAAHDKQVTFPEWGLVEGSNGGGDSPAFVQDMYNWMAHSNLAYESYWDYSSSSLSDFPHSEALYKKLFG